MNTLCLKYDITFSSNFWDIRFFIFFNYAQCGLPSANLSLSKSISLSNIQRYQFPENMQLVSEVMQSSATQSFSWWWACRAMVCDYKTDKLFIHNLHIKTISKVPNNINFFIYVFYFSSKGSWNTALNFTTKVNLTRFSCYHKNVYNAKILTRTQVCLQIRLELTVLLNDKKKNKVCHQFD